MSSEERELNKKKFAGDTLEEERLWYTYVYWARERAKFGQSEDEATGPAVVDDPINRVEDSLSFALQTIVFSAFALEYRVKRVLIFMGAEFDPREPFKKLLKDFWDRLSNISRLYKKGKCEKPIEWNDCLKDLLKLVKLRNDIAHANYCETLSFLSGAENSLEIARKYYRSVVDAIMLINIGTGYGAGSYEEAKKNIEPLILP